MPGLITRLERLRSLIGNNPIIVTSGFRCTRNNYRCGGVKQSYHLFGAAADIKVKGMSPGVLGYHAKRIGFSFIKVYDSWLHVDVR